MSKDPLVSRARAQVAMRLAPLLALYAAMLVFYVPVFFLLEAGHGFGSFGM